MAKLKDAISSVFGASVSIAEAIPSAVEKTVTVTGVASDALLHSVNAVDSYAIRWELDALNELAEAVDSYSKNGETNAETIARLRAVKEALK